MADTFQPMLIAAGLVLCLFGWTLYWAGIRLLGAACGAVAAAALTAIVIVFVGGDRWLAVGCAIAAALGAIGGVFLITQAHYLLFFVTGAVAGLATAWVLEAMLEASYREWMEKHLSVPLGRGLYYAVFTMAGGLLVLLAHRVVVITLTSLSGTVLLVLGLPRQYGVWLFLPVFFGSLLLQLGILRALGQ
ncbi:DUF4203 domain-containing protein, partial [Candidatus Sumerlaeota bacterium]|nr:DUF4203 domain-containing protein [Candidatus Sumerlaeota bacterium]